ncbi:hypothetical protein NIES3974_04420 [Calothrix sp. NIES-3974]|nr:hypothetical protein NIES3974_04420 [Calothrix sp. NIES-3974]
MWRLLGDLCFQQSLSIFLTLKPKFFHYWSTTLILMGEGRFAVALIVPLESNVNATDFKYFQNGYSKPIITDSTNILSRIGY